MAEDWDELVVVWGFDVQIYGALGVEERARARIQNNEEDLRLTFAVLPLANHFLMWDDPALFMEALAITQSVNGSS